MSSDDVKKKMSGSDIPSEQTGLNDIIQYLLNSQCPIGYYKSMFNIGYGYSWTDAYATCFKNCKRGFYPWGHNCWATCDIKDGKSTNDWFYSLGGLCLPNYYYRGLPSLPDKCATDREYLDFLCYPKCDSANGYVSTASFPFTCSQKCPPSTTSFGPLLCLKNDFYYRGMGNRGLGCSPGFTDFYAGCVKVGFSGISFEGYNCPTSGCDDNFGPIDPNVHYYYKCKDSVNDPKLNPSVRCSAYNEVIDPNTGVLNTDIYFNTKQVSRNNEQCEENNSGVPYCYPKCDVGFTGYLTECLPDCGKLTDLVGACGRGSYTRGAPVLPGDCADPNRTIEGGLCVIPCKESYHSATFMCIKDGCPDNNYVSSVTGLCVSNSIDNSDGMLPAYPPVSDTINATWDLAAMGENFRTIILNAGFILGAVLIVLFVLGYNTTLRSKPLQG